MAHEIEITDAQIEAFKNEAAQAGDDAQLALCELALDGDAYAREVCVGLIEDAAAQD